MFRRLFCTLTPPQSLQEALDSYELEKVKEYLSSHPIELNSALGKILSRHFGEWDFALEYVLQNIEDETKVTTYGFLREAHHIGAMDTIGRNRQALLLKYGEYPRAEVGEIVNTLVYYCMTQGDLGTLKMLKDIQPNVVRFATRDEDLVEVDSISSVFNVNECLHFIVPKLDYPLRSTVNTSVIDYAGIAAFLLECGAAKTCIKDDQGNTILHKAVRSHINCDQLRDLLHKIAFYGGCPMFGVQNNEGYTPSQIAALNGYSDLYNVLVSYESEKA